MIQLQKQSFAKSILSQVAEAKTKTESTRKEIEQVKRIIAAQKGLSSRYSQADQASNTNNVPMAGSQSNYFTGGSGAFNTNSAKQPSQFNTNDKAKIPARNPTSIQIVDNNQNIIEDVPGLERLQRKKSAPKVEVDLTNVSEVVKSIRMTQTILTSSMRQEKDN